MNNHNDGGTTVYNREIIAACVICGSVRQADVTWDFNLHLQGFQ